MITQINRLVANLQSQTLYVGYVLATAKASD